MARQQKLVYRQRSQVYTDESSGVAAHDVEKSYGGFGIQSGLFKKARNRKLPRDLEIINHERRRLSRAPEYT